jgi:hypothetical protein
MLAESSVTDGTSAPISVRTWTTRPWHRPHDTDGQNIVKIGDFRDWEIHFEPIQNHTKRPEDTGADPHLPVSLMTCFAAGILGLPPRQRDVVCWRYLGLKYADIAVKLGISATAAERLHARALKRWPPLNALFSVKAAKQRRRRPRQSPTTP